MYLQLPTTKLRLLFKGVDTTFLLFTYVDQLYVS